MKLHIIWILSLRVTDLQNDQYLFLISYSPQQAIAEESLNKLGSLVVIPAVLNIEPITGLTQLVVVQASATPVSINYNIDNNRTHLFFLP